MADLNGDRQPDYLLYNAMTHQTAIWYLNNNVFVGAAFGPTLPAKWNVVGVADFNGDVGPDYLLFNSTSHQTAIWYLSGTTLVSGAFGPSLPNGWDLVAVGDFKGDGKPDYVLYNAVTHQTAIWYLNNNVFVSAAFGPTVPANWKVVGVVADFNHGGEADYLLYNASTRQTANLVLVRPYFNWRRIWPDDCKRLYFDRSGRFQRGRQARLRALWSERPGNHPLVSRQQCLHRQRQWSHISGRLGAALRRNRR